MIFHIKHRWQNAVVATLVLAAVAWLGGGWGTFGPYHGCWQCTLLWGGIAGGAAVALDGAIHGLALLFGGTWYRDAFRRFATRVQGTMRPPEFVAGSLMAAVGEEPFFRGLLLQTVLIPAGLPAVPAVLLVGLAFAAAHTLRGAPALFWWWGFWEGVFFGWLQVASGSLVVPMIAHGVHDLAGYLAFGVLLKEATVEAAAEHGVPPPKEKPLGGGEP